MINNVTDQNKATEYRHSGGFGWELWDDSWYSTITTVESILLQYYWDIATHLVLPDDVFFIWTCNISLFWPTSPNREHLAPSGGREGQLTLLFWDTESSVCICDNKETKISAVSSHKIHWCYALSILRRPLVVRAVGCSSFSINMI